MIKRYYERLADIYKKHIEEQEREIENIRILYKDLQKEKNEYYKEKEELISKNLSLYQELNRYKNFNSILSAIVKRNETKFIVYQGNVYGIEQIDITKTPLENEQMTLKCSKMPYSKDLEDCILNKTIAYLKEFDKKGESNEF